MPSSSFPPGFGPGTYGDSFADVYDQWYPDITDAAATARFVAERCSPPTVIELGVGTGRLVPELTAAGLRVIGVDSSTAMLATNAEPSICADITALPLRLAGSASAAQPGLAQPGAALCAFNTLFNLPSARLQQRALEEAARSVVPKGKVIIEAITGHHLDEAESQSVGVSRITAERLVLAATVVDHLAQTVTGQHLDISEAGGIRLRPWHLRWTTPSQLDELAVAAGLTLTERYASWDGEPFTEESDSHISVYEKI